MEESAEQEIINVAKEQFKIQKQKEQNDVNAIKQFRDYPHLFLLSCVIDSGNSTIAWNLVQKIAKKIGSDFKSIYNAVKSENKELKELLNEVAYRNSHIYFNSAVKRIEEKYESNAALIWEKSETYADVIVKMLEFKGVGIKKATMTANLLYRMFDVKLEGLSSIDISPDVHVKRTMYKLGLINPIIEGDKIDYEKIDPNLVIYKARAINPDYPGILDFAFWDIGKNKLCTNDLCLSGKLAKCPFENICREKSK